MPPQMAKSLMKDFRASFRRKKSVLDHQTSKADIAAAEELAKLTEMKENLGNRIPFFYGDSDLIGFLRARSLNVKEAEKLLKLDENVNRFLQIDSFRLPEENQRYNFSSILGFDKEGSLVRLINLGKADGKGLIHLISTIDGLRLLLCMVHFDLGRQEAENKKSGRTGKQVVYLVDLEDLSMSQVSYKPAFDMVTQILKLMQDHCHDVLKAVYLINAPPFFSSVYKLIKPVMQDSLQEKIVFLDGEHFRDDLLKRIDAEVLPKYLGGTRVDSTGDPKCKEFVLYGGVVPEEYYASNFLDPEDPEVVVATIPAGATLNFRFPVRETGSVFRWHLQGKDNDIAIGLYREPFSSGTETPRSRRKKEEDMSKFEQLTPVIRSQCHLCPEEGQALLWFTGNVILHFDNSYSWMNSKEVLFKISVTPPTDEDRNRLNVLEKGLGKMNLSH